MPRVIGIVLSLANLNWYGPSGFWVTIKAYRSASCLTRTRSESMMVPYHVPFVSFQDKLVFRLLYLR